MSRDITKAHETLQEFWAKLKPAYEALHPEAELIITHVNRTPVEQLRLFVQGRLPEYPGEIVTRLDGFVHRSKHNATPAEAFDVAVRIRAIGKMSWSLGKDTEMFYIGKIGAFVESLGYSGKIKWGGVFGDMYHFEVI